MKHISFMLIAVLTLSLTSLFIILTTKPKEYVFTNAYIDTKNWVSIYGDTDACEEIYQNLNGDLVMVLTSEQRKDFLKYDITQAAGILSSETSQLPTLSFSEDFGILEVVGTPGNFDIENSVRTAIFNAQLIQVLSNGSEDWKLEVVVRNRNTDAIIQTFLLPHQPLNWNF